MRIGMSGLLAWAVAVGGCGSSLEPGVIAIRITETQDSLQLGRTTRLSVVVVASDSQAVDAAVVWETLDPLVLSTTSDGLAKGVGIGTGRVTATSDGLSDTAEIVVVPPVGGPEGSSVMSLRLDHGPWDVSQSSQGLVYVTRSQTDSIARVDIETGEVLASFAVGNRPDEVWFNALGTRAFVTNVDDQTVGVIDPETHVQTATFPLPGEPLRLRLGPGETKLYVTQTNGDLSVLDAVSGSVDGSMPIGGTPNGMALSTDGSRLYVSSTSGTVTEINTATDVVTRTFTPGGLLQDLALSPDDATLYVASEFGSVFVLSRSTGNVTATIPVPGAFGLALTPDASQLWVTQPSEGTVTVIDCASRTVLRAVLTWGIPRHIVITPEPLAALVTNEAGAVQLIR
jgi:YVTN family beta-propeller protein